MSGSRSVWWKERVIEAARLSPLALSGASVQDPDVDEGPDRAAGSIACGARRTVPADSEMGAQAGSYRDARVWKYSPRRLRRLNKANTLRFERWLKSGVRAADVKFGVRAMRFVHANLADHFAERPDFRLDFDHVFRR